MENETILLSAEKNQYKANLHCHSTLSDGKLTPQELKAVYKAKDYDILAITDHCRPMNHQDLSEEDFLLITGYEAYIRPTNGKSCPFKPEVHLNLFARDPENLRYICYNQGYCKYIPVEEHGALNRVGSERPREYTTEYINEFIRTARENGYLVTYNHPFWSMESEERILSYEGCFSLELYNTGSDIVNGLENGEMLYDVMLRHGMRIGCHGGDDNHNKEPLECSSSDSFGGHTVILADRLEYGQVIDALDKLDFYASTGARIHEIKVYEAEDGRHVRVKCSNASRIYLFFGAKSVKRAFAEKGKALNEADFLLHPKAKFIRISVCGTDGSHAVSRGYFPDEWLSETER